MKYIFLFIKMNYNIEFQLLHNEVVPEDRWHEDFWAKQKESWWGSEREKGITWKDFSYFVEESSEKMLSWKRQIYQYDLKKNY